MNERLKKLRKVLGLTQQEFADKLRVSRSNIATYEVGKNNPTDAVINLICREFNVNEDWLRTGTGEMFINRSRDEELTAFMDELLAEKSAGFRRRLVTALSRLSPEQWDALEAVALELMKESATPPPAPTEQASDPLVALTKELTALKRQNAEMAAEIAAMKEEDAAMEQEARTFFRVSR